MNPVNPRQIDDDEQHLFRVDVRGPIAPGNEQAAAGGEVDLHNRNPSRGKLMGATTGVEEKWIDAVKLVELQPRVCRAATGRPESPGVGVGEQGGAGPGAGGVT